jgi:hypothetical protein
MSDLTTAEDRCRGALVGLAAGDRIGGPIRMAVRLAESLVEMSRFDAADVLGLPGSTGPLIAQALPHPRDQLVANPLCVFLVPFQLGLQRLVFPPCPQDQQGRRQASRNQRP